MALLFYAGGRWAASLPAPTVGTATQNIPQQTGDPLALGLDKKLLLLQRQYSNRS